MTSVFRVRDWASNFEVAQSRRKNLRRLSWVAVPNRHDGRGFRRLIRRPDGVTLYGAWQLIVQVASKCKIRGTLADDDGPLTAADIADATGASESTIKEALEVLSSPEIKWIERVQYADDAQSEVTPQSDCAPSTVIPQSDDSAYTNERDETNETTGAATPPVNKNSNGNGHDIDRDFNAEVHGSVCNWLREKKLTEAQIGIACKNLSSKASGKGRNWSPRSIGALIFSIEKQSDNPATRASSLKKNEVPDEFIRRGAALLNSWYSAAREKLGMSEPDFAEVDS